VEKPDSTQASAHTGRQDQAVDRARQILENAGGGEIVIHGRDGRVRDSDTVAPGRDPNPPRDKK
jgi:hypothetical protein